MSLTAAEKKNNRWNIRVREAPLKRPEGYFAGKLIMDAGLRGFRIGGAQVSEKHCGFVINVGNASSADVREVIDEVRERVKQQFGVTLEPEVVFLGEF